MDLAVSTVIDRPVPVVWGFYVVHHVKNHPRWDPSLELEATFDGPVTVGSVINRRSGPAYVGSIGEGLDAELTAGDLVNTTARLASAAAAGEVLVTLPAATATGLPESLERRSLELKGKREDTEVAVLAIS